MKLQLNKTKWSVLVVLLLVLCVAQIAVAETIIDEKYKSVQVSMSNYLQKMMAQAKVMGMSIALVDDQQVVWAEGFGFANVQDKLVATPETVYEVGSISKMFTATATMRLAEAGKVDIDQPLYKYLPEFTIKSRFGSIDGITPRRIMYHHSGLPSDLFQGMWGVEVPEYTEAVKRIKDSYVAFPPDHIFSYSNLAVTLLGDAVSKVANEDFVTFTDNNIFLPLGMSQSSFALKPEMQAVFSKGYVKGKETAILKSSVVPAGALLSNVLDLSKYMEMVFADGKVGNQQFLQPETLQTMFTVQNDNIPLDFDSKQGLGCFIGQIGPEKMVYHGGDTIQFHSMMAFLPQAKLGVVVLTNTASGVNVATPAAFAVLQTAYEVKSGTKLPMPTATKAESQIVSRPIEELQQYAGLYSTDAGLAEIKIKSGSLHMNLMGANFKLQPTADGTFIPKLLLLGFLPLNIAPFNSMEFTFAQIENHDLFIQQQNGRKGILGEKVQVEKISDAWVKRAGSYEILNPDKGYSLINDIRLEYKSGVLVISANSPYYRDMGINARLSMVVKPISDTEAIIVGVGRNKGDTISIVSTAEGEKVLYSGFILKKKSK